MFNRARADFAPFRGFSAESRAVVVNRARDQVERFMTDLEKHLEAAVKVIDTFDELDEVFNECEKNSTFNEQVDQEIVEQVNILNADYDQILTKGPPPVNGSFDLAIQINISEVESVVEEQKKWIAEPDTDSVVSIDTQVESHIPAQIEERVKTPPPPSPTPPVENKLATAVRRGRGRDAFEMFVPLLPFPASPSSTPSHMDPLQLQQPRVTRESNRQRNYRAGQNLNRVINRSKLLNFISRKVFL